MKVTRILNFTEAEITALTVAGKILGEVAEARNEETADDVVLGEETKSLVEALKEVLGRI